MKTRATITIDPKLHNRAKRLARQRRTTFSGLIEDLISTQQEKQNSAVDKLIGSAELKASSGHDPKRAALEAKYLR